MLFGKKKKEVVVPEIKSKQINLLIFLAYIVLGGYFINKKFAFISIPEKVLQFDSWIVFVGGIFLILGAINYYKASK